MAGTGVNTTGWDGKTLLQEKEDINNRIAALIGASANTKSTALFGQLRDLFSDAPANLWQAGQSIYTALTINASGQALDNVAALSGKTRLSATFAQLIDFKVTITGAVTYTTSQTFSVTGNSSIKFAPIETFSETVAGDYRITVRAVTAGDLSAPVTNTVTNIDNPTANLTAVTNDSSTIFANGRDPETDAELRSRIQISPTISTSGPTNAIEKAILDLNETVSGAATIESAFVIENDELTTDADGREGKSIEVVVYQAGGATSRDSEIASVIAQAKTDGIKLVSTTGSSYSETIVLDSGNTRDVIFSRPSAVPIYCRVDTSPTLSASEKTQLIAWIAENGNELGVNGNVVAFGKGGLSNWLDTFEGADLTDYEISITTTGPAPAPAPNPGVTDSNITIGYNQISTWAIANISIGDL